MSGSSTTPDFLGKADVHPTRFNWRRQLIDRSKPPAQSTPSDTLVLDTELTCSEAYEEVVNRFAELDQNERAARGRCAGVIRGMVTCAIALLSGGAVHLWHSI